MSEYIYRFSNVNRTCKTFLDDKRVASSLEKGRLFVKYTLAERIFYFTCKRFFEKNPTVR